MVLVEKTMNKVLLTNIVSLGSLRGLEYILNLMLLPFLVRVLGPERFGAIAFMQSIIQYFIVFVDYGFNMTAPRAISQQTDKALARMFSAFFVAKLLLAFSITALFLGGYECLRSFYEISIELPLFWAVYLLVIGNVLFPIWFFQGIQRMQYITIVNVLARSITVLGIFYCVRQPNDYLLAAFFQSCTSVFAGVFSLVIIYRKFSYVFVLPSWKLIRQVYKDGWDIFISTLAINIYTASNVVVLSFLTSNTVVGYYSSASKIIECVKRLLDPVSQAIYPHVCQLVQQSRSTALAFLQKILRYFFLFGVGCSFCLLLFAVPLVHIVLGEQYEASVSVLQWMAFVPFMVSLSNVFGTQTLLPFGMERPYSRILIASAVLNTVLIFPLTWYFGAVGTAATMLVTETFVTVMMGSYLCRENIRLW